MADRISALDGHYQVGRFGVEGDTGLRLTIDRNLVLHQASFWPGLDGEGMTTLTEALKIDSVPDPCASVAAGDGNALRIEPLKIWLFGTSAGELDPEIGATLDLSHSRTHVEIRGDEATTLLNRLLPLDLRDPAMPAGAVASSALHHVGVTLWRRDDGDTWSLFIPRGFAVSVWEILFETALQFGVQVENR